MLSDEQRACRTREFAAVAHEIKRLQTDRHYRETSKSFFAEGVRNFVQAVDNGLRIQRILFSDKLLTAPLARKLVRRCRRSGVPTLNLTPEQFRQVSQTKRASGISAIIRQRWVRLSDASPTQGTCWVLLEKVRSPGNLGTLIRSSEAFGAAGFVLIGNQLDVYSPDVVRASMGSIYKQALVRTNWAALRDWIEHHKVEVLGATPEGGKGLAECEVPKALLLILGEERKGLTPRQRNLCRHLVQIPMEPGIDSLNLGVAGSVFMYEVYRRRREITY